MKLKKKPIEPKRKKDIKDCLGSVYFDGVSVDSLRDHAMMNVTNGYYDIMFKACGITVDSYTDFVVKEEYDHYDDCSTFEVYGIRDESDKELDKRMASYKKRKTEYDKWYKENKKEIKAELQKREDAKVDKKAKEIASLEAKLERLKKNE